MRKISIIVLAASTVITVAFLILWALGFAFAGAAVGNLIHVLLVLAVLASFGIGIGLLLLIISFIRK